MTKKGLLLVFLFNLHNLLSCLQTTSAELKKQTKKTRTKQLTFGTGVASEQQVERRK